MCPSRMCPQPWQPCWLPRPRLSLSLEENPQKPTTLPSAQPSPPCQSPHPHTLPPHTHQQTHSLTHNTHKLTHSFTHSLTQHSLITHSLITHKTHTHSSTNLNELAKAVRLLAALNVEGVTPDDLLRAARALANATAGLLNASTPENLEVSGWVNVCCT